MKERSKERLAALLMEELLEQLAERENIKHMFANMTSAPMEQLLESLLDEFEQIVEKHYFLILDAKRAAKDKQGRKKADAAAESARNETPQPSDGGSPSSPVPAVKREPERSVAENKEPAVPKRAELKIGASPIDLPPPTIDIPMAPLSPSAQSAESERMKNEKKTRTAPPVETDPMADLRKLEEVARKVEGEYKAKMEALAAQEREAMEIAVGEGEGSADDEKPGDTERPGLEVGVGGLPPPRRAPCTFEDDEYAYLHGVMVLPEDEKPSAKPFFLQEKGIDSRGSIFATDYEGMRFFLSKVNPSVLNISKTMMLLLGKQESLQLRGMHQNIVNDLRGYGMVLPFEFGSVVRGADDMFSKVDKRIADLREALEDFGTTSWWMLNLMVLDARIASLAGTDASAILKPRERIRQSYTPVVQPKYDIKMLEKILKNEKKIAESVHKELSNVADRSDIESMIGLGSGSTDDWKSILKASYEVQPSVLPRLFRTISDLQYHHIVLELMFVLTGKSDDFSLKAS